MGAVDHHESVIQWKISRVYQLVRIFNSFDFTYLGPKRTGPGLLTYFLYSLLNILGCDVTMWSVNNWIYFVKFDRFLTLYCLSLWLSDTTFTGSIEHRL